VRPSRAVPGRVVTFTGILFATAAAIVARSWNDGRATTLIGAMSFVLLLAAAEYLILRFRYDGHIDGLNLFEAALAPALVVMPTAELVLVVAGAQIIGAILRRNMPVKAAFNVAQWSVGAAVGSVTFRALSQSSTLTARNTLALVVALATVVAMNITSFTYVIGLAQRRRTLAVLRGFARVAPLWGIQFLINVTLGLVFAATYQWSPAAIVLFFVPLAMLHLASRGYAAAVVDQERLAGMHRATRTLAGPVDPRDAITPFLQEVRRCFSCEAADLVLLENGTRIVYRVRAGETPSSIGQVQAWSEASLAALLMERETTTRVGGGRPDAMLVSALEQEGWRDCLATPLIDGDLIFGVLITYNRTGLEGFETGEETVIEALAGDAARAMVKAGLLDTILEERRKLSDIVGRTSDGILTLGPGGTVKTWNAALQRITGFSPEEMIGSRTFNQLHPRNVDGSAVWLEHWADDDALLPADLDVTTRGGEARWLSCSYTRVHDAEGRPSMLIVVARDATEARELERLKDDFVATVSHELRTPLTPIKGWAMTLLQLADHLDEAQRIEGMRAILRHAERLERLITNILEVSKVERGLSDRREAIVDVRAIAEKVAVEFRAEHPARDIRFRDGALLHHTRGDEVWVEQILSNLVSNALKYSPADRPIDISVSERDGTISLAVRDEGPGISEVDRERIFERFKRLGDHMTRSQGGTGLGLYIAKQLARAIGGELIVDSVPGDGATFTLRVGAIEPAISAAS
jgi:PAS domain S-box-containing protein